jgi:hypothetical protein
MKASTTTLFNALSKHSEIYGSLEKEPNFFASNESNGMKNWGEYQSLFSGKTERHKVTIEASPEYTRWPQNANAAKRMRENLGDPKLIYVLRDPVERTISHYFHSYARSFYKRGTNITQAIQSDPILLSTSRYASQLDLYDAEFGEGGVLIITAEHLRENPEKVLTQVAQYLSVDPAEFIGVQLDAANTRDQMSASVQLGRISGRSQKIKALSKKIPAPIKSALKNLMPTVASGPTPTSEEKELVLEKLRTDVFRLRERLGTLIDHWPSVKLLVQSGGPGR